jgi:hypothetical protein
MLHIICPIALVSAAIWPSVNAKSRLLVYLVLPFILTPIRKAALASAVHHGLAPFTPSRVPINLSKDAEAIEAAMRPRTSELGTVGECIDSEAFLVAIVELACILGTLGPGFHAKALLLVMAPFTLIFREVLVIIDAIPMGHVRLPLADVNVTTRMEKPTAPFSTIVLPLAFITGAIRPPLHTEAMPRVAFPLPSVNCAAPEFEGWPIQPICTIHLKHIG